MAPILKLCAFALAAIVPVFAKNPDSCPKVQSEGTPVGKIKNVDGIDIYHSYPPSPYRKTDTAILYVSDIYGLPLLEGKLLADSIARANHLVIFPDLFNGDAIPVIAKEPQFNMTEWSLRHNVTVIDSIIAKTIHYMKHDLGIKKIGAVGYCFGGKYVPRFLAKGKGIDVGFIAHPSGLQAEEIRGIDGPISIAAGELDFAFTAPLRRNAEDILSNKSATFETALYSKTPHGFGVRVNASIPQQKFAKEASFRQAVNWLDAWL